MKSIAAILALACALGLANGAPLAPGLYSLKNVGYKTCDQESVYLGFNNKTCPIAPYSRPASIGTNSVWKSWDITITGYHSSGFPLAYLSTGLPEGKTMRCPGNLSPLEPGTCGKSAVTIDGAKSEWRLVGPVSGYTNPTYKLVANMKKSGCARYLQASSSCEDSSLKMATSGDSSRALWELTPLQLGTKAPGAATIVTVTRGSGSERTTGDVSFVAPEDPGCGPIVHYDITAKPISGGGATITKEVSGSKTSATLTGMTANIRYNVTISATNACGEGSTTWYVETLATSDAVAAAGDWSICAVKADSSFKCFDVDDEDDPITDVPTKWKSGNDIVQIVTNNYYTAALARNGTLGVWGLNIEDGCTAGDEDDECIPEGYDSDVAFIHGWYDELCITKTNGDATCIGYTRAESEFEDLPGYTRFGSDNDGYDGYITGVKMIKAGDELGCVVYKNGNLRCWNDEEVFESDDAYFPLPISFYTNIVDVGVTDDSLCALKSNGDLACSQEWKYDDGDCDDAPIPETFDRGVAAVDCAGYAYSGSGDKFARCCAWKANGDFTCWGLVDDVNDGTGDLEEIPNWIAGINKYTWRTIPACDSDRRKLAGYDGRSIRWPVVTDVVSFSLGEQHTCIIRKDGSLQCWGNDSQSDGDVDMIAVQNALTLSGFDYLF